MCELFAMSSRKPATVTMSLQALAEHGGKSGPHKDGWGIAYYHDRFARLIKDTDAAHGSDWIHFVESRDLSSNIVIAHLRNATQGEIALWNTHPFARELGGHTHVFAHNGTLGGIEDDSRFALGRHQPLGTTDSEYAFCALLDRLETMWLTDVVPPTLSDRLDTIAEFAHDLRSLGPSNFVYSDSKHLFAHASIREHNNGRIGPPGLQMLRRFCDESETGIHGKGIKITSPEQEILLLASVPLTDEQWTPLPEGELLALDGGCVVGRRRPQFGIRDSAVSRPRTSWLRPA